jgi:hypothetical protein
MAVRGDRMRKSLLGFLLLTLCGGLVGCGAGSTSAPAGAPAAPSPTSSQPAGPASSPSVRTQAENTADLKKALVNARDLGAPWIQPKSVATAGGKKGEVCPGHSSAVTKLPPRAAVQANFTEGKGAGKNIATFELSTLTGEESSALEAAYTKDQKACATYKDASGLYVVRSLEGPSSVVGADEVVGSWAERIYYDKSHNRLAYARHYLVTRTDHVITYLSFAFLAVKKDPGAKDFTRATDLLEIQLRKNAKVFS